MDILHQLFVNIAFTIWMNFSVRYKWRIRVPAWHVAIFLSRQTSNPCQTLLHRLSDQFTISSITMIISIFPLHLHIGKHYSFRSFKGLLRQKQTVWASQTHLPRIARRFMKKEFDWLLLRDSGQRLLDGEYF